MAVLRGFVAVTLTLRPISTRILPFLRLVCGTQAAFVRGWKQRMRAATGVAKTTKR